MVIYEKIRLWTKELLTGNNYKLFAEQSEVSDLPAG